MDHILTITTQLIWRGKYLFFNFLGRMSILLNFVLPSFARTFITNILPIVVVNFRATIRAACEADFEDQPVYYFKTTQQRKS